MTEVKEEFEEGEYATDEEVEATESCVKWEESDRCVF